MPEGWVHCDDTGLRGTLSALGIAGSTTPTLRAPIVAFLLEHPRAGVVLIDTGFHADVMSARARAIGTFNSWLFRSLKMRPEQTIAAQLAARGLAPQDVELIVMTHLHVDHASALRDFPNATVLVSDTEWHAAHARGSAFAGYHSAHFVPSLSYRLVHHPAAPDAATGRFAQAVDVFGDGSLRLVSTPGHTTGHQSLLVRLRDREALLTGDAIYTLPTLREGKRPFRTANRQAYEKSVQALAAYDRAHPDALIVPGHDMDAWSALQESYS
jgi:glyoxylase-like metal-dependent hydrolase (beta-lactamase superfamily II)